MILAFVLLLLCYLLLIIGIIGSVLPAIPGPPIAWIGLLLFYLIPGMEINYWVLGITGFFTLLVVVLDYVIPAQGTKKFGGSKYGVWGTNLGLIAGLFFPPLGFVIGPFLGAFVGEILFNPKQQNRAFKAAFGSFLGFLTSVFMKLMFCFVLLGLVVFLNIKYWKLIF